MTTKILPTSSGITVLMISSRTTVRRLTSSYSRGLNVFLRLKQPSVLCTIVYSVLYTVLCTLKLSVRILLIGFITCLHSTECWTQIQQNCTSEMLFSIWEPFEVCIVLDFRKSREVWLLTASKLNASCVDGKKLLWVLGSLLLSFWKLAGGSFRDKLKCLQTRLYVLTLKVMLTLSEWTVNTCRV